MRNGRKIANHARMNIRLTSKVSAGKQNFCPAEAFLLTLKQILPDSQKSANYPYRVKEMQNLSAVTKTGQEIIALLFLLSNPSITLIWQATFQTESSRGCQVIATKNIRLFYHENGLKPHISV
jgi:hypothetical protein